MCELAVLAEGALTRLDEVAAESRLVLLSQGHLVAERGLARLEVLEDAVGHAGWELGRVLAELRLVSTLGAFRIGGCGNLVVHCFLSSRDYV